MKKLILITFIMSFSLTLSTNAADPKSQAINKNKNPKEAIYTPQGTIYTKAQLEERRIRSAEVGYKIIREDNGVSFKFKNQNLASVIKESAAYIEAEEYTKAIELLDSYKGEESNYDVIANGLRIVVKERLKKKK